MKIYAYLSMAFIWFLAASCTPHATDTGDIQPPPDGVGYFSVAPVDVSKLGTITALGHITGAGHVLPTTHAYIYSRNQYLFYTNNDTTVQNIYVPATASVYFTLFIPNSVYGGDWKIMFRATQTFYYTLDHIVTSSPPSLGTVVHAGDLLGQTYPGGALDVGAFDTTKLLTGFVNPSRYAFLDIYCVTPWQYFIEPIKSQIYSNLWRSPSAPPDARVDQDVAGTLAGNWFEQSLPVDPSITESPTGWSKTVSFAVDEYDGTTPRFSCGGWPGLPNGGIWAIPAGLNSWSNITVSSGIQYFPLMYFDGISQSGLLTVQMITDSKILIEIWPGSQATNAAFDSNALYYIR